MNQGVKPYYTNAGPNQNAYYWGAHPYMKTMQDLMTTYNNVPAAPPQPFGPTSSAVGGTGHLDIAKFIMDYLGNPVYQAAAGQPAVTGPVVPNPP
jgi:hypothetical protein